MFAESCAWHNVVVENGKTYQRTAIQFYFKVSHLIFHLTATTSFLFSIIFPGDCLGLAAATSYRFQRAGKNYNQGQNEENWGQSGVKLGRMLNVLTLHRQIMRLKKIKSR